MDLTKALAPKSDQLDFADLEGSAPQTFTITDVSENGSELADQQPVTRPQIEAVRGVNSDSVIKNLLTKGLIEESGRAEGPGRPVLYSTTTEFMQHFGLASLTDLPPLTPLSADPAAEAPTAESILKG